MTNLNAGPRSPELYDIDHFIQAYRLTDRIARLANARDLMSFGPSQCNAESALEERFITSPNQFKPELKVTSIENLLVYLEDEVYTSFGLFMKQGGNSSASAEWLGDIKFSNDNKYLDYSFYRNGNITVSKREHGSKWLQRCLVREPEVTGLIAALTHVKETLSTRKGAELLLNH